MARQKGIIRLRGSLGGITFYQQEGENLSRETNGPSKEKIANDPAFKRTRENNQEFAGAATAGKALRQGMQNYIDVMSDSRVTSALMKQFRIMINRATTGVRGQRPIDVVNNKDLLVGFNFNRFTLFDSIMLAPFTVATNAGRTEATFTIPDFSTVNSLHAPQGATHFNIIATVSVLSNYSFDVTTGKYTPDDVIANLQHGMAITTLIPIGNSVGSVTTLTAALLPPPIMSADCVLIACIGIEFYQQVAGNHYLLAQGNSMKIASVF